MGKSQQPIHHPSLLKLVVFLVLYRWQRVLLRTYFHLSCLYTEPCQPSSALAREPRARPGLRAGTRVRCVCARTAAVESPSRGEAGSEGEREINLAAVLCC